MRAIFIAVGSELLDQDRADTNSLYVARRLREHGILLDAKMTVGDDLENLSWVIKRACQHAQLVIITGGLGPTEDDLTREAVAGALKKKLVYREELVEAIRERFRRRRIVMPEINTRQAFVVDGAEVIPNSQGTAPGQYFEEANCRVLLLPGPPGEMIPMFESVLAQRIAPLSNYFIYTRQFKFAGISESEADAQAAEIYTHYRNPQVTILASPGMIELHLLGRSKRSVDEAKRLTDELADKIRQKMSRYIFAEEDISLEQFILKELGKRQLTLAVAESCTGGGFGHTLTNVPGSSDVFLGGVIAYANDVKTEVLGVEAAALSKYGAVSAETARQMAAGVRRLTGAAIGVAITGIAGPGGGSEKKPVGLVHSHLQADNFSQGVHSEFLGSREMIKLRAVFQTLNLIREYLKETAGEKVNG